MTDTMDVRSQVALAALLDTSCLEAGLAGTGMTAEDLLAGDGATDLLAAHPTVHRLVMAAVSAPGSRLRATVASRPDLDDVLYPMLASDPELDVRISVATNHSAPDGVVDHLAHDPEPEVRDAAMGELRRRAVPSGRTHQPTDPADPSGGNPATEA